MAPTRPAVQSLNQRLKRLPAWPIYLIAAAWAVWLFYRALRGDFVDPVLELEHRSGLLALQLLVATLVISPLRDLTGLNLVKYRRALGLSAFFYTLYHLGIWAALDLQSLSRVIGDIVKRPYITVGMAALLLLIPLALTSNDRAIRKLGPRWRKLHWLTYPAVLLAAVHFILQPKTWEREPMLYLLAILALLAWRVWRRQRRQTPPAGRFTK